MSLDGPAVTVMSVYLPLAVVSACIHLWLHILQHASVNSYPHSQLQLEASVLNQMNVSVIPAGMEVCVISVYLLLAVVSIVH